MKEQIEGKSLKWHQTLSFKTFLIIILLAVVLLMGIVAIMSVWGNRLVLEESKKLIEESGNSAVAELKSRLNEIEALARTLSESTKMLPRTEEAFLKG